MKLLLVTWNVFKPCIALLVVGLALVYLILSFIALVMTVLTEVLNAA